MIEYMFGIYPEGLGFRAANVEQSRVYGLEFELMLSRSFGAFRQPQAEATLICTLLNTMNLQMKIPMCSLNTGENIRDYFHSGAQWKKFNMGLNLYIKSKILNIDEIFLTTPILPGFDEYWAGHNTGYGALDVNIGYRITEKFSLSLAVKNITNTEYMGRPGDIQPQRNFSLRFSGKL